MEPAQISTDWHREDIIAAVRKNKKSLSALSREYGLLLGILGNALTRPWPRSEEIIASIIGLPPEEIWPSRYKSKKNQCLQKEKHPFRYVRYLRFNFKWLSTTRKTPGNMATPGNHQKNKFI